MPIATYYEITHTCGHTATRDLSRKLPFERASFVKWLVEQPCRNCDPKEQARKEKWRADKQAEARVSVKATEKRFQLEPVAGPEKIRDWAIQVRAKIIQDAWDTLGDELGDDVFALTITRPASRVNAAGWWIDNRGIAAADLATTLAEALNDEPAATASIENPW